MRGEKERTRGKREGGRERDSDFVRGEREEPEERDRVVTEWGRKGMKLGIISSTNCDDKVVANKEKTTSLY